MPTAEIITIGTELLLGEIQDTNTRYLARLLRDSGVDLYRTAMVGDNPERIAQSIRESLARCEIVLTTGGLGPTVDDPTRQAVALALGVETEFHPELWEQIQARFARYNRQATENNKRQAFIPRGATAIENAVGTAPAFRIDMDERTIISLPGVPREMEHIMTQLVMPYLRRKYNLKGAIKALVLHTAGVGESQIDEWIGDLETHANPTVGLLAHPGQVDVRITAKADSIEEADRLIAEMAETVRQRLGEHYYGSDDESLEDAFQRAVQERGWGMVVVEAGLGGELLGRLTKSGLPVMEGKILPEGLAASQMTGMLEELVSSHKAELALGAALQPGEEKQTLTLIAAAGTITEDAVRAYGGPGTLGRSWAVNTSIDFARRFLIHIKTEEEKWKK